MKYCIIPILFAILSAGLTGCGVNASPANETAAACLACHTGTRSFAGREAAAVAEQIRLVRDGKIAHPPLTLDDTSDEALEALAAELVSE